MRRPERTLHPRVLIMWWTMGAALVLVATVVAVVVAVSADLSPWLPATVAMAAAVLAAAVPPLRYRRWRYEIRQRDLFLSHGALFQVLTLIPFDRIQFVETHQGPLDRLFGLTQLVVFTAAGRAGQIPGLEASEAEALREELSKVAGVATV
jgi:membrane protein YdbS with pleckstrin-like domain